MEKIVGGILLAVVIVFSIRWYFGTKKLFADNVRNAMEEVGKTGEQEGALITEEDLESLPALLQDYMREANVVGSPRVRYFHVVMKGEMKLDQDKPFAPIKAEQYTFTESGKRLFFITMNFKGLPISGLHYYYDEDAYMKIKILDMLKVADHSGIEMQRAETVTYFNDLCIMAPGALLDEEILWEEIDEKQVKGTLKKHNHEVSAVLSFNEDGMLENFVSDDRLAVDSEGNAESVPWSTPMDGFGEVGAYFLPNAGSAVWHYHDGEFEYIRMGIESVEVNGR